MPHVKPEFETSARLKVIGVGGSGQNAVDHMIRAKVRGVDFISVNTDAQDLHHSLAPKKLHIGRNITRGLGSGMNPDLGKQAAEESKREIEEILRGADLVFVTCGFGGGTGTGAGPAVAEIAKNQGSLTIAIVTRPFSFEGETRRRIAEEGLVRLRKAVDAMIIIPNDRLVNIIERDTPMLEAFAMCDEVLRQAVQGIADLIITPGIINVDFADVRTIMQNSGSAIIGIGTASGKNRAQEAARMAINSPLLEVSAEGAKGVLFTTAGREDLSMWEVQEAAKIITENVDKDAKIIFGAVHDERLRRGEIRVTVIASGFPDGFPRSSALFQGQEAPVAPRPAPQNSAAPMPPKPPEDNTPGKDNEEEWEIPAFLRRSKKL